MNFHTLFVLGKVACMHFPWSTCTRIVDSLVDLTFIQACCVPVLEVVAFDVIKYAESLMEHTCCNFTSFPVGGLRNANVLCREAVRSAVVVIINAAVNFVGRLAFILFITITCNCYRSSCRQIFDWVLARAIHPRISFRRRKDLVPFSRQTKGRFDLA